MARDLPMRSRKLACLPEACCSICAIVAADLSKLSGRVSKALIQEAVTEAVSSEAAERIAGLKKADMAGAAEALLRGSGWLPKQLRPRSAPVTNEMQQAAE